MASSLARWKRNLKGWAFGFSIGWLLDMFLGEYTKNNDVIYFIRNAVIEYLQK